MGYVHPDRPDIFLSYAHVDNKPPAALAGREGWVTTLARGLNDGLARKLGRPDSYVLWSDAQLAGHVELTPEILGQVRDAAVLLLVLSPGYLASEWCRRELAAFRAGKSGCQAVGSRIFVVEFNQVAPSKKPPELADLRGYPFWVEHPDTRRPKTLGYPIVREADEAYYDRLDNLCFELVRALESLRRHEKARGPGDESGPSDRDASRRFEDLRDAIRCRVVSCLGRLRGSKGGGEPVLRRVAEVLEIEDFPDDRDAGIDRVADHLVDPAHNHAVPALNSLIVELWDTKRTSGPVEILDECLCLILPLHFSRVAIDLAAHQLRSSAHALIERTVTTDMGAEVLWAALDRHKAAFRKNDSRYRGKYAVSPQLPALGSLSIEADAWAFIEAVLAQGPYFPDQQPSSSGRPIDDARKRGLLSDLQALVSLKKASRRTVYCVVRRPDNPADRDHAQRVYQEVRKLVPLLPIVVLDEDALARGDEAKILSILKWRHAETRNPHAR